MAEPTPDSTRTEKDSMGAMEVPIDALWGASTQRAVLNFPISGLTMPPEFLRSLGLVKWAAAQANKDLKILDAKVARIVATGAEAVVANDTGCLIQLAGGLCRHGAAVRTLHLAQVLAPAPDV